MSVGLKGKSKTYKQNMSGRFPRNYINYKRNSLKLLDKISGILSIYNWNVFRSIQVLESIKKSHYNSDLLELINAIPNINSNSNNFPINAYKNGKPNPYLKRRVIIQNITLYIVGPHTKDLINTVNSYFYDIDVIENTFKDV